MSTEIDAMSSEGKVMNSNNRMCRMRCLVVLLILALMLTGLAGCGEEGENKEGNGSGSRPAESEETLVMAYPMDTGNLNPHAYDSPMWVQAMAYEGLTRYIDGEVVPGMAESWDISEDGREYIFYLREGNVFNDGTPVTAGIIKRNFDAVMANGERHNWVETVNQMQEVTAVDELTLKVVFGEPFSAILQELSLSRPLRIGGEAMFPEDGDTSVDIAQPVGSGMWKQVEHVDGQYTLFEYNENYWGEKPQFQYIKVRVMPDINTAVNSLKAGEIDLIYDVASQMTGDTFNDLKNSGFQTVTSDPVNTYNLLLNSGRGATQDLNVRLALQYATDKDTIAENVFYGLHTPADRLLPRTTPYCDIELTPFEYDLDKACTILEESGWMLEGGSPYRKKDGQELEMKFHYIGDNESDKTVGQVLQDQYKQAGVKIELVAQDNQGFNTSQKEGLFELMIVESWGDPFDPHSYLSSFRNPAHGDYAAQAGLPMKDEIDAAISKALNSINEEEVAESYEYVLRTLHEQGVYVPLTNTTMQAVFSDRITGVRFNTTSDIPFEEFGFR